MEQGGGISIISPPGITENSNGKSKSIGITLRSNGSIQNATKKLKSSHFNEMVKLDVSISEAIRIGMGEMVGTAILVFIGCLGCVGSLGFTPPLMQICFSFGFAVMIAIQAFGHVSGAHINPAITVAALVTGNITLPKAVLYVIAQCFGAIFGYGALKIITPMNLLHGGDPTTTSSFCVTVIHHDLSTLQGLIVEIIATGILALFACGVWDIRNKNNTDSVPLRFGFCVSVLCFVFVPYSGCSMNPARSLGPAIWNGFWMDHWVFWLGPILGALISSSFYRYVLQPKYNEIDATQGTLGGVET